MSHVGECKSVHTSESSYQVWILLFGIYWYVPVYTGIYRYIPKQRFSCRWSGFQMSRRQLPDAWAFRSIQLCGPRAHQVQRCAANLLQPFSCKTVPHWIHSCHRLDLVIIRPPGIDNGAFVVKPETVWYARVLLLFSASVTTDTGSKAFDCALVSTLETYDDPENGYYCNYMYYNS